jgi:hypothetical protein
MKDFEIQNLKDEIGSLRAEINDLKAGVYKNNFSSTQVFNKSCIFNDRLKVPTYTTAPDVGEQGDVIGIIVDATNCELYICTTKGDVATPATFTQVGTQS